MMIKRKISSDSMAAGVPRTTGVLMAAGIFMAAGAALLLGGCAGDDRFTDLHEFMADIRAGHRGQVAPLPEFKPYQPFAYDSADKRSPFEPPIIVAGKTRAQAAADHVRPPPRHVREYLEGFELATLAMVGTLVRDGTVFALVRDSAGGVHRVAAGDYLGVNYGRVAAITEQRIDIIEIVSDGGDGWLRRPRSLELDVPN